VLEVLDADAVRRWYRWGLAALEAARPEIDSLNVFPVADADTGTNLHLTLAAAVGAADGHQAAVEATEDRTAASADLGETATAMARACLLGARGGSGVILSQFLRGLAEVLAARRGPAAGLALTRALERGVELAYGAVSRPVEGTMLTVARAAAEAAGATGSDDLSIVAVAAASAARVALAQTPTQLAVLGQAGVVDAGGRGIVILFDVLQQVVEQSELTLPEATLATPDLEACDLLTATSPEFEVMYLIDADDARIPGLRTSLDDIGDAVVVSGGDGLFNVHVHTDDVEAAVELGVAAGRPHEVRVTRLRDADVADEASAGRVVVAGFAEGAPGLALRELLTNAGAVVVEAADYEALATDVATLGRADVVVLADEAISHPPAAAGPQRPDLVYVPIAAPVQALSAIAVHDPHRPLDDDAAAMAEAAAATRFAAVVAPTADDLCRDGVGAIMRLLADGGELVTVVSGADVGGRIAAELAASRPDIDVNQLTVDALDSVVWIGVE